jgi:hypothetical protein
MDPPKHYLLKKQFAKNSFEFGQGKKQICFGLYDINEEKFEPFIFKNEPLIRKTVSYLADVTAHFFKDNYGIEDGLFATELIESSNIIFPKQRFTNVPGICGYFDNTHGNYCIFKRLEWKEYMGFVNRLTDKLRV